MHLLILDQLIKCRKARQSLVSSAPLDCGLKVYSTESSQRLQKLGCRLRPFHVGKRGKLCGQPIGLFASELALSCSNISPIAGLSNQWSFLQTISQTLNRRFSLRPNTARYRRRLFPFPKPVTKYRVCIKAGSSCEKARRFNQPFRSC